MQRRSGFDKCRARLCFRLPDADGIDRGGAGNRAGTGGRRIDGANLLVRFLRDVAFIQAEDEYEKPAPDLPEHGIYDPVGSLGYAGRTGDRLHDAGR